LRWCLFRLAEAQKQFTAVSDNIMSLNSVPKVVNRAGNGEASTSIAAAAGEGGRGSGEAERKGGADQACFFQLIIATVNITSALTLI
jgi:hypothetical protein